MRKLWLICLLFALTAGAAFCGAAEKENPEGEFYLSALMQEETSAAEEPPFAPAPVHLAADVPEFDGVWEAVYIDVNGNVLPVEAKKDVLEQLLGVDRFELSVSNGSAQWFGEEEAEAYEFQNGVLRVKEEPIPGVKPGTLDRIIALREDGMLSFTILRMTFFCEKTEKTPELTTYESAAESLPEIISAEESSEGAAE